MLLDTHVWIWLVAGESTRLGARTRRQLVRAASTRTAAVSAASAFEIAALATAGRLRLTQPVERWIRESCERSRFRVLPLDRDIATDAGLVPATALPDPVDRLLVATAREHDLRLVTCDERLLDYAARTRLVSVLDGRT